MIRVLVRVTVAAGKRQEYLDSMRGFFSQSLASAGCLEYESAVDISVPVDRVLPPDDDVVTFVEKWESIAAYAAHARSDHARRFAASTGHFVRHIDVQLLKVV